MGQIVIRNGRFCFYVFVLLFWLSIVTLFVATIPGSKMCPETGASGQILLASNGNDIFGHSMGKFKIIIWFAFGGEKESSQRNSSLILGATISTAHEGRGQPGATFKWATEIFGTPEGRHRHRRSSILSHNSGSRSPPERLKKVAKFQASKQKMRAFVFLSKWPTFLLF